MIRFLLAGDFRTFFLIALVLVIALSLHEFAHALAADLQGDPTARLAGRLTINPLAHLDPVGTLMMVLAGFGWGKPVPFSLQALKNRRFGAALVAVAGPAMNILLALAAAMALGRVIGRAGQFGRSGMLLSFLELALEINVVLALFNLIPVPPLDGSRILSAILPPDKQRLLYYLDRWGFFAVIALLIIPWGGGGGSILGHFLFGAAQRVSGALLGIAGINL
jgi:Zn-dependent protease